jgi:ubiquitin C-terminal hydrolase
MHAEGGKKASLGKSQVKELNKHGVNGKINKYAFGSSNSKGQVNGRDVDEELRRSKQVLHRRISFVSAKRKQNGDILGQDSEVKGQSEKGAKSQVREEERESVLEEVEHPLYPRVRIKKYLRWRSVRKVGPGLVNMGNTCFCNSVLQCLTYTPPLANFCLDGEHTKRGGGAASGSGFDAFAAIEKHVCDVLQSGKKVAKPSGIVTCLRKIGPHFRLGRQEDAHEFARLLMEGMLKADLKAVKVTASPYSRIAQTGVVHAMFGGHLRSQVRCGTCNFNSNTFDAFLDLSLEVNKADSIARALQRFTAAEILDGPNKYKCSKCGTKTRAQKRFTVHTAPYVLTLHLKRFESLMGRSGKITKHVKFTETLDLSDFMSEDVNTEKPMYHLYAVLVHSGHSTRSGHYFAFVKNSNGVWYEMNDDDVRQVSLSTVMKQQAYMLFYIQPPAGGTNMPNSPALCARPGTSPLLRAQAGDVMGLNGFILNGKSDSLGKKNSNNDSEDESESSSDGQGAAVMNGANGNVDSEDEGSSDDASFRPSDGSSDDDDEESGSSEDDSEDDDEDEEICSDQVGGSDDDEEISSDDDDNYSPRGRGVHDGGGMKKIRTKMIQLYGKSWRCRLMWMQSRKKPYSFSLSARHRQGAQRPANRTHGKQQRHSDGEDDDESEDDGGSRQAHALANGGSGTHAGGHASAHVNGSSADQKARKVAAADAGPKRTQGVANMNPSEVDLREALGVKSQGQFASKIGNWEIPEAQRSIDAQKQLLRTKELRGTKRRRDDWDEAYDAGRAKKVREKKVFQETPADSNPFQKASEGKLRDKESAKMGPGTGRSQQGGKTWSNGHKGNTKGPGRGKGSGGGGRFKGKPGGGGKFGGGGKGKGGGFKRRN